MHSTDLSTQPWSQLKQRVNRWASEHARTEWSYNAPYVWWRAALVAGVITQAEHNHARQMYGNLWNYVGD